MSGSAAGTSPAHDCLEQARAAALTIKLPGDQSAALRSIALTLANLEPYAALNTVAGMRRPSDAARSLGAASVALAATDPAAAVQNVTTAGRLLLRIPDPDHRAAEQRLLLADIAPLGAGALVVAVELSTAEAQLAVLLARADSDAVAALGLLRDWNMTGAAADRSLAAIAPRLSAADPDQAVELAATIASTRVRDQALWIIAERRPPAEAIGIAQRVADPVISASVVASASARMASKDADAAIAAARALPIAPDSALAQVAIALASVNPVRAVKLARSLPTRPSTWALGRIAAELAASEPQHAENLLAEGTCHPETVRLALARMAAVDADRAVRIGRSMPGGDERDAALAAIARTLAGPDVARANDLLWDITSPHWRGEAVEPVALRLAETDCDAATSLIGLVSDPSQAGRLRARVAAAIAARDPKAAGRLLESLPSSDYRSELALQAAIAVLSAGGSPETALRLATIGLKRDLAFRWTVPTLARTQARSPFNLAASIQSPYLRALGLVDVARELLGIESKCRPVPERARQIRPIAEWAGV